MKVLTRSSVGRRSRLMAGALLAGTLTAGVIGSETLASAAPMSGSITVNGVLPMNGKSGPFVITGSINDAGISPSGGGGGSNNTGKLVLSRGTINLNTANAAPSTDVDMSTCTSSGSANGTVKFTGGTRAYKGIRGTINVTLTSHIVGRKIHGKCSTNASPIGGYFEVTGTGTVTVR